MYIIASDSIEAAQRLAPDADARASLDALATMVDRLHELETAYPQRMLAARKAAGETVPPLSRAARDEIEASEGAAANVLKLQRRRCRRAMTAHEVIEALIPDARYDLKAWEWMLRECDTGPPRDVLLEIVETKRSLVDAMRDFGRRFR